MLPFTEVRVLDLDSEHAGVPIDTLMENAGRVFAESVVQTVGKGKKIALVCGTGNNGGNGFVAARYLQENNHPTILLVDPPAEIRTEAARKNFERVKHLSSSSVGVAMSKFDVIIDALLGTGTVKNVREPYRTLISRINESGAMIISLDVPSGLGTDMSIHPSVTITFHDIKEGMTEENSGKIIVRNIGIPPEATRFVGPGEFVYYPTRDKESHKGMNGRVLIIGGGPFTGAPALGGLAAYRTGVDLVHIATPWISFAPVAAYSPNLIVHRLSDDVLVPADLKRLNEITENVDSVLIGPGLGTDDRTKAAVREYIKGCEQPMVIDADGITAVSEDLNVLIGKKGVITPHSGEFTTLTGEHLPKDLDERGTMVADAAAKVGMTLLVKGRIDTISDGQWTKFNKTGNAGMSVGGTGDVLAGEVAALMSKGVSPFNAARIAAFMNGTSGDIAFEKLGYSIMATDVIDHIPEVLRRNLRRVA